MASKQLNANSMTKSKDLVPDLPQFYEHLEKVTKSTKEFEESVGKVRGGLERDRVVTDPGVSLLELKNHTMLQYLINLSIIALRKVEGTKEIDETVRWPPIENRTVIERLRPLEQKIQYQIDKLLRGDEKKNAALSHKPDLDELESSEDEETNEGNTKYKAPRVAPVHYYEQELKGKRTRSEDERPKLGRGILEELRQEISSAPSEVHYSNAEKRTKAARERTEYEESNFLRMNLGKSERKKPRLQSGLNNILNFDEDEEMFRSAEIDSGNKKFIKKKGKGKGKKFRKRR